MGEGDGVQSVDNGTGGVRDVVGDRIASVLGVEEVTGRLVITGVLGTACALGVDLEVDLGAAAAAVAAASVVDWGIATALEAVLTATFASAVLGAA